MMLFLIPQIDSYVHLRSDTRSARECGGGGGAIAIADTALRAACCASSVLSLLRGSCAGPNVSKTIPKRGHDKGFTITTTKLDRHRCVFVRLIKAQAVQLFRKVSHGR